LMALCHVHAFRDYARGRLRSLFGLFGVFACTHVSVHVDARCKTLSFSRGKQSTRKAAAYIRVRCTKL
jgi:hypothetical protein